MYILNSQDQRPWSRPVGVFRAARPARPWSLGYSGSSDFASAISQLYEEWLSLIQRISLYQELSHLSNNLILFLDCLKDGLVSGKQPRRKWTITIFSKWRLTVSLAIVHSYVTRCNKWSGKWPLIVDLPINRWWCFSIAMLHFQRVPSFTIKRNIYHHYKTIINHYKTIIDHC